MEIIKEFRLVTEQIAVVKSRIRSAERDLEKFIYKSYCPPDVKAIEYKERVQTSMHQIDMFEMAKNIIETQSRIHMLKVELESWYDQRDELEKTINSLGDVKKKVAMLLVKGEKQWRIAKEMNYSTRRIEQLVQEIKKDCGEISV